MAGKEWLDNLPENDGELLAYYPQPMFWDRNTEEESMTTETTTALTYTSTTTIQPYKVATIKS